MLYLALPTAIVLIKTLNKIDNQFPGSLNFIFTVIYPAPFTHKSQLISHWISRNSPGTVGICSSSRFQRYRVGEITYRSLCPRLQQCRLVVYFVYFEQIATVCNETELLAQFWPNKTTTRCVPPSRRHRHTTQSQPTVGLLLVTRGGYARGTSNKRADRLQD